MEWAPIHLPVTTRILICMRAFIASVFLLLSSLMTFGAEPLRCPSPVTEMNVAKGQYSPLQGAVFNLEDFAATMVARGKTSPLCFARMTQVQHGGVLISSESLTRLFSQKVKQSKSSITDVKVELQENTAQLTGKIHKGVGLPFTIEGPVSTDGTSLILQAKKIKVSGIPMKALLGMVGKDLGSMVGSESVNGVAAKGDTLIFEPSKIAHVRGRIEKAQITSKGLALVFAPETVKTAKQMPKAVKPGQ